MHPFPPQLIVPQKSMQKRSAELDVPVNNAQPREERLEFEAYHPILTNELAHDMN
jgi:hypothetical protein